ncbi:MAG TPA: PHB depolymerase family esterase [Trebonia sp.]|nr:PHB depolymerase family esterase [Trebonia sp.]
MTDESPGRPVQPPSSRTKAPWAATAVCAVAAALSLIVYALTTATHAQANTSTLTAVSSFGSNPGSIQMYDYVPTSAGGNAPLVVALHGCTQTATDYYNDSGWPQYADQWGFDVVFPQQTSSNNSEECFDWFTPSDDSRGNGEAESIMQMVDYMEAHYSVNAKRIFITGLSAGGGMTADMLADYPDVFASGAIDSGLPAQCATSQTAAYTCMDSTVNNSVAQWAALATNSDPGYTGTWPTVQIWQGTSDYTVSTANSTELMDQWTGVQGVSQTASSTESLTGGTTEKDYDNAAGQPVVETFAISGMGHGLAVNPGSAANQCGATGAYFLNYICSTYYTATFWGLNNSSGTSTASPSASPTGSASASPTGSASASPTSSASASPSPSPTQTTASPTASPSSTYATSCYTASNYAQTVAGRAHQSGGYAYANGSNQNMGLWNTFVTTSLEETSAGYYVIVSSC